MDSNCIEIYLSTFLSHCYQCMWKNSCVIIPLRVVLLSVITPVVYIPEFIYSFFNPVIYLHKPYIVFTFCQIYRGASLDLPYFSYGIISYSIIYKWIYKTFYSQEKYEMKILNHSLSIYYSTCFRVNYISRCKLKVKHQIRNKNWIKQDKYLESEWPDLISKISKSILRDLI